MKLNDKRSSFLKRFKSQWMLQICALLGIAFLIVYSFLPMVGIVLAFNNYKPKLGFMGFFTSEWVGFKWFKELIDDPSILPLLRNTLMLSFWKLVFSFPLPIIFAMTINEIHNSKVKRVMQTVSYLPHFISWVIVQGVLISFLNMQTGVINQVLLNLGFIKEAVPFLSSAKYFLPVAVISDIWKEMGWWSVIFLAAITGIDPTLYEAAMVDGASRIQRIGHITLPSLRPTIMVVLILSLGNLLGGGLGGSNFEQSYLLGNALNSSTSEILQTYTLKMGLSMGRYSFATAVGLMQSILSVMLVLTSNKLSRKITGDGLF